MSEVRFRADNNNMANTMSFYIGGEEMLRVSPDGFWVRGQQVNQGPGESQAVYNAFREYLTWAQLTRP